MLMINTWGAPLQASQNSKDQMTDGTFFIYNQVTGNGAIIAASAGDGYTANGTLGQVLSNIGLASSDLAITQHAGFWHGIEGTEETLLSFAEAETIQSLESDAENIVIPLALSQPSPSTVTVTIDTIRSANCDSLDYTLSKDSTVQNSTSVTVVFLPGSQTNSDLSVEINNDRLIEFQDEMLTFSIAEIEGDSTVHKGPFSDFVINIPANDIWPLTGTVQYLGSQTGDLIVEALDHQIPDASYPVEYDWETDTTTMQFMTIVPPGTYTICAYIDSKGAEENSLSEWEVSGAYTWTVTIDDEGNAELSNGGNPDRETFSFDFVMDDPDDRYTAQFIEPTGSYKEWIDFYPAIGDPDEDFDKDGYTNFQEYLNGTDPTSIDPPYVYNGYDPAFDNDKTDVINRYQIITTNPLVPKARLDESFLVDINYTTSDNNQGTTGLGLAIHFNSTFMDFAGWSNVLTDTLAGDYENLTITVKDEDDVDTPDDGFEDTDKVITIAWVSDLQGRSWPGLEVPLPLRLCTLQFAVKSEAQGITYGDTSVLRFSATSKDARYAFYASPATVEIDPFSFDVDGNGKANALTDGLLIMRYLFGLILENSDGQEDAIADNAIRRTSQEIWVYLNNGLEMLDIDGNKKEDALTDGLLIMRYMFGFTSGDSLIENAIAEGARNDTDEKVVPYIKQYLPHKGSPATTPTTD